MKENYFKSVVMIERLHRLFLEVVKVELDRMKIRDINNVQCLVLYNVGRGQVTVGELTNRGYYLGSNVSYNLRKMVQNSYLIQEPSSHDRRSSHVKLSDKGMKLHDRLDELFTMHAKALAHEGVDDKKSEELDNMLTSLEGFWTSLLTRDLRR
ncbi:MAG: MarR family winged helix-turn-helix transcriptional regulator [Candidatus Paracaedibacter sp.]|jgi:DNA-binding MarR family transcriptional regulator